MIRNIDLLLFYVMMGGGVHSPPLAYSIIRYRVFSVSITSNNWTATNKEIVTTKTHKHAHPPHATTDSFVWIATHLCLDDSGFSWCVPLEITEIQNVNNERSNSASRKSLMRMEKKAGLLDKFSLVSWIHQFQSLIKPQPFTWHF